MKFREPGSFADALFRIGERLGWPETARLANRAVRTVRDWSEPDTPRTPPIAIAAALDRAWSDAGGHGSPLRDALDRLIARPHVTVAFDAARLGDMTAVCIREGAGAHAALVDVLLPGATVADRREAAEEIQETVSAFLATIPLLAIPCTARGPPPPG